MSSLHQDYHAAHRMMRVLIVTESEKFSGYRFILLDNLSCWCSQFVARGARDVHVLKPVQHKLGVLDCVRDVFEQSVKAGRPYDLIIADSVLSGKEIARLSTSLKPKPGILIYAPHPAPGTDLTGSGFAVFDNDDFTVSLTEVSKLDKMIERILGKEGVDRLKCRDGEQSTAVEARTTDLGYIEVKPSLSTIKITRSGGKSKGRI